MYRCIAHGRYSPNELRYLPLNTALYEPPLDPELPALDSEPDSDDAEDGKEDKKNKNSSVRHSGFSISSYTPHPQAGLNTQTHSLLDTLSCDLCSRTGQFFRQCVGCGDPGGRSCTRPQVQGKRQDAHAEQRRQPSAFCLPQSHPRVQGRGQNHLNSSPTTAAALFYPPPPLSTTPTPLLHPSRHPSLAFFTLFSGFYRLSAF